MKTFLISYDLASKSVFDYTKLIEHIKSFNAWAKPLESVWLVKTDINPMDVVNRIRELTSGNDKVLVIEITNNWASFNLSKDVNDWMRQIL